MSEPLSHQRDEPSVDRTVTDFSSEPLLSTAFVQRWLKCLHSTFGYRLDFPFATVRTLTGRRHFVCAPLLSYAHLDRLAAASIAPPRPGRFEIRHLAPLEADAPAGTAVISALPLHPWAEPNGLWEHGLSADLRKKIRRASKEGWIAETRTEPAAAALFYPLFAATMHRHGTPPYPENLFTHALADGLAEVVLVHRGGEPLVAYFVLFDAQVALFQWAGFHPSADVRYASLLGEWTAVQAAFRRGCHWFDLGRAPLGGGAWKHKQYWRPRVFRAVRTPAATASVYDKYRVLAACWRRLPAGLAKRLGPRIIRHLSDA